VRRENITISQGQASIVMMQSRGGQPFFEMCHMRWQCVACHPGTNPEGTQGESNLKDREGEKAADYIPKFSYHLSIKELKTIIQNVSPCHEELGSDPTYLK
jgi:hypothetical protein